MADALAITGDEGRGSLRKASGSWQSSFDPEMSEWENNEEAGEHWTPRDVVELMADLVFIPIADQIQDATYSCYDGACGTGGMLTVAQERLLTLAHRRGKDVSIHLFGQEINPETYAICTADMLLKGDGDQAEHIGFGSTLSLDQHSSRQFDFMLSNLAIAGCLTPLNFAKSLCEYPFCSLVSMILPINST